MAAALLNISRLPPPEAAPAAARMLAELRGGVEIYRGQLRERLDFARRADRFERVVARVRDSPRLRALLALRRFALVRLLARPLRPLTSRARRLLS
jgi:hypothetical protein